MPTWFPSSNFCLRGPYSSSYTSCCQPIGQRYKCQHGSSLHSTYTNTSIMMQSSHLRVVYDYVRNSCTLVVHVCNVGFLFGRNLIPEQLIIITYTHRLRKPFDKSYYQLGPCVKQQVPIKYSINRHDHQTSPHTKRYRPSRDGNLPSGASS